MSRGKQLTNPGFLTGASSPPSAKQRRFLSVILIFAGSKHVTDGDPILFSS